MWYAIIGQDVPDSLDKRMAARPAHVARLQELAEPGAPAAGRAISRRGRDQIPVRQDTPAA